MFLQRLAFREARLFESDLPLRAVADHDPIESPVVGLVVGPTTRRGFFDFDNFEATRTVVPMAAGANAVIARAPELGACPTIISSRRNISSKGRWSRWRSVTDTDCY